MALKKKKGFPVFWTCFAVFVVLMVAFWAWVMNYVKKCLVIYEDSQPEYAVEAVIRQMEDKSAYGQMDFAQSGSRFENENIYKEKYLASLEGKTFTYEKSAESYNAKKPVYKIYADGTLVAKVTLSEISSRKLMFILFEQEWGVKSIEPVYETGSQEVTVVAPDTYSVFINNVKLDTREQTGNSWDIGEFQYAAEYVAVPRLVEYRVEGLLEEPEVTIYDNMGKLAEYDVDDMGNIRLDTFPVMPMDAQLSESVLQNAKDYSNFFSKDLEGCRESVAPIAGMFPADSYYLELAENYRVNDMWMYSAHAAPTFSGESVTNYTMYTPEFFAADVYFEKNMVLTANGEQRQDITNTRFYYAKIEEKWVIVDMQAILKE